MNPFDVVSRAGVQWHSALGIYAALSAVWIGLAQAAKATGLEQTTAAWLLGSVLLPLVMLVLVLGLGRGLGARASATDLLQLRMPTRFAMAVALLAGLPGVACVAWHVFAQPGNWLWTWSGANLALRIVLNQGLLEELIERGLLM